MVKTYLVIKDKTTPIHIYSADACGRFSLDENRVSGQVVKALQSQDFCDSILPWAEKNMRAEDSLAPRFYARAGREKFCAYEYDISRESLTVWLNGKRLFSFKEEDYDYFYLICENYQLVLLALGFVADEKVIDDYLAAAAVCVEMKRGTSPDNLEKIIYERAEKRRAVLSSLSSAWVDVDIALDHKFIDLYKDADAFCSLAVYFRTFGKNKSCDVFLEIPGQSELLMFSAPTRTKAERVLADKLDDQKFVDELFAMGRLVVCSNAVNMRFDSFKRGNDQDIDEFIDEMSRKTLSVFMERDVPFVKLFTKPVISDALRVNLMKRLFDYRSNKSGLVAPEKIVALGGKQHD